MEQVIYKKSLVAKLTLTRGFTMDVYQTIKDLVEAHKTAKTRLSFDHETINVNKKAVAKIRVARKNIVLYLNLDPTKLAKKYKAIDVSSVKAYADLPTKVFVTKKSELKNALELIERVLKNAKATELTEVELTDYNLVYPERTFTELYKLGLIKRYVRIIGEPKKVKTVKKVEALEEDDEDDEKMYKVSFTAKLLYEATSKADVLFIVTSYNNWDFSKAIKMDKVDDNTFTAIEFYPAGTKLEFKVCKSESWADVEKGIWKEEIVNHNYVIVDNDLDVEDLIHNFRID